jgi:hypothetical protein
MELAPSRLLDAPLKRRPKRTTRPQLLTRSQLDGRTNAAKVFDKLVADIESDLAGRDQLTAIERALVEAFAGAYVSLCHLNALLALGKPIDISQHSQCCGALVRIASRLGLQRRAKDVGPTTLAEYLETLPADVDADEAELRVDSGNAKQRADSAEQYPVADGK